MARVMARVMVRMCKVFAIGTMIDLHASMDQCMHKYLHVSLAAAYVHVPEQDVGHGGALGGSR